MEWRQPQLEQGKQLVCERLEAAGLDSYRFIEPSKQERKKAIQSIAVVLFPYYAGKQKEAKEKPNLSLYCRGQDYHAVVPAYLNPICEELASFMGEGFTASAHADTGPLQDRFLALRAGLGFLGKNQMVIHPRYGSYVFVAYMLFNAPFSSDEGTMEPELVEKGQAFAPACQGCNRCLESCPGGALQADGSFQAQRCCSEISQKKGELSEEEQAILRKGGSIFGCDICQLVCPHNEGVPITPLPEFQRQLYRLDLKDIEGLTRRQLLQKYPDRAFTWRGPAALARNLRLLETKQQEEEQDGN